MFKKSVRCLLASALSLIVLFSFAACGNKEESKDDEYLVDEDYLLEELFGDDYNDDYFGQSSLVPDEEEEEKPQLTDGTELDIYPIIEQFIVYSGGNGGGQIELKIPEGFYQEINGCYFKANEYYDKAFNIIYNNEVIDEFAIGLYMVTEDYSKEYYSNGDVFKIEIERPGYSSYSGSYQDHINENIYKHGFIFPQVEKLYTVSGLGEYITSYTQLSAEELENIKNFVINDELSDDYCNLAELKGCYEGKIKPFATTEPGSKFVIYVTFYSVHYQGAFYETNQYKAVAVNEIVRKPDGTISFEKCSSWFLGAIEETLEGLEENISSHEEYDFVKIG
ncbi:MAG: hypothetical protein IKY78_01455 [Clostridia bacterium]|nr:hypothetical protein [Clostridia bacterium]